MNAAVRRPAVCSSFAFILAFFLARRARRAGADDFD